MPSPAPHGKLAKFNTEPDQGEVERARLYQVPGFIISNEYTRKSRPQHHCKDEKHGSKNEPDWKRQQLQQQRQRQRQRQRQQQRQQQQQQQQQRRQQQQQRQQQPRTIIIATAITTSATIAIARTRTILQTSNQQQLPVYNRRVFINRSHLQNTTTPITSSPPVQQKRHNSAVSSINNNTKDNNSHTSNKRTAHYSPSLNPVHFSSRLTNPVANQYPFLNNYYQQGYHLNNLNLKHTNYNSNKISNTPTVISNSTNLNFNLGHSNLNNYNYNYNSNYNYNYNFNFSPSIVNPKNNVNKVSHTINPQASLIENKNISHFLNQSTVPTTNIKHSTSSYSPTPEPTTKMNQNTVYQNQQQQQQSPLPPPTNNQQQPTTTTNQQQQQTPSQQPPQRLILTKEEQILISNLQETYKSILKLEVETQQGCALVNQKL
ncbi:hypothetical protein CAS74_004239 [Pichia kudriavzevii]|uniref:Uncharacterized protein n=1 Tax=Pichia kudriavzevii TaxID=4909 RepID=A0A1Z8JJ37_PICKU|nr:hypothetical protein CAS74_004239 [Pichia kudriavzevii]